MKHQKGFIQIPILAAIIAGGQTRQTHIQFHGQKSIHPRTLKSVIRQSGIPQEVWVNWR